MPCPHGMGRSTCRGAHFEFTCLKKGRGGCRDESTMLAELMHEAGEGGRPDTSSPLRGRSAHRRAWVHFKQKISRRGCSVPGRGGWLEGEGENGLSFVTGSRSCSPPHRTERAVARTGKGRTPRVHRCHVALQVVSAERWAIFGQALQQFPHVSSSSCTARPSWTQKDSPQRVLIAPAISNA